MDLVATNEEGSFVPDLNPEEIELFEDGKRQTISLLQLQGGKPPGPAPQTQMAAEAIIISEGHPLISQKRNSRYFVFLLDLDTIDFANLRRTDRSRWKSSREGHFPGETGQSSVQRPATSLFSAH